MFLKRLTTVLAGLLILALLFPHPVFCQGGQDGKLPAEKFNFGFDIGRFRAQNNFVLLELYYSIYRNYLKFVPDSTGWRASFVFNAEIWQHDSLLVQDEWKSYSLVDSLEHIRSRQKLFGVGFFAVRPDTYLLKVRFKDLNSNYEKQKQMPLVVESFDTDNLTISDIELATRINRTTQQSIFFKNGYQVIPNPDRFYGTGMPMLMFYSEIYNLRQDDEQDQGNYSVQYRILDSDGQVVREFPPKVHQKPGESAVEASGMNIISFRSGTYFLELTVNDQVNNVTIARRKKFFIFRQGDLAVSDSVNQQLTAKRLQASFARIYKNMSSERLDQEFDAARYIATKEEKKIYKTLDVQGKQAFLLEFWRKRDDKPETPQNEFRENYLKLVNTANKEFSGFKDGYKTDRGRVLLLYGVPDEIERFPLSMEHREHHIWKYFSIQGGVIFVFVDKQGFGDLELVHSTARGELNDPDWQRWINPNR